jgi:hypothetical protein
MKMVNHLSVYAVKDALSTETILEMIRFLDAEVCLAMCEFLAFLAKL